MNTSNYSTLCSFGSRVASLFGPPPGTGVNGGGQKLTSHYLKSFIVARVNPIRFRPKDTPPLSFDEALDRMMNAAAKFNPDKIKLDDLARSGGAADEAD